LVYLPALGRTDVPGKRRESFEGVVSSDGDHLRRSGRRWRSKVGHKVSQRKVYFVSDGGDDRRPRIEDRPRDPLFVEGPKVLARPSTPADDYDIDVGSRIQRFYRPLDLESGAVTLDFGRRE
jgi:hypothetical protein